VEDSITADTIWWGDVNHKISPSSFSRIKEKMLHHLISQGVYIQEVYACSTVPYRLPLTVITEHAWQSLFVHNMFLHYPPSLELKDSGNGWTILCAPGFEADPSTDGTRAKNFTIINFTDKCILIGGSAYTGEIKKSVFTILNYLLPTANNVLPMHCSANVGEEDDTAIFFGLSGTGKTTLSADPKRRLIGDDEHGWDSEAVFNFEGGCYAKCVNLSEEKEPQIFHAIKPGTLLENVSFYKDSSEVDYANISKTENTRAAYPLHFINNVVPSAAGCKPKNIFFLTADAFGVLPPISKLTIGQAMYHFISGYTAKVAGTETGITAPQTTFSACFGKPFLPLHPTKYAALLGEKLGKENINVWLVNTGWNGGQYGTGERIPLKYTRSLITAALTGALDRIQYIEDPIFGLHIPVSCPEVPSEILNPGETWKNKSMYVSTAKKLAAEFMMNFSPFEAFATPEIISGGPKISNHTTMKQL
jgi:phosphoenolpyruvate carboxykinase (ATP)